MPTSADEPERVACDVVAASAENTKPNGLLEKAPQLDDWDMQVNVAKTKVDFLVANRDWAGAAVAQEEVEKLEALAKEMRAKNTMKYEPAVPAGWVEEAPAALDDIAGDVTVLLGDQLSAKNEIIKELAGRKAFAQEKKNVEKQLAGKL